MKCGFEKVKGWECLFVHKQLQLFLSIYVDGFKMAGKSANMANMWTQLNKHLDLEDPVPM